jgi:hypothetical protein
MDALDRIQHVLDTIKHALDSVEQEVLECDPATTFLMNIMTKIESELIDLQGTMTDTTTEEIGITEAPPVALAQR